MRDRLLMQTRLKPFVPFSVDDHVMNIYAKHGVWSAAGCRVVECR